MNSANSDATADPGPKTFTSQDMTKPAESIGITSCTGQFMPSIVSTSVVDGAIVTPRVTSD